MITYIGRHLNTWVTKSFTLDIYNFQALFSPRVVIATQPITICWMIITYEMFLISSFRKLI